MINKCETCWWNKVCKRDKESCKIFQGIDLRWEDSPNND